MQAPSAVILDAAKNVYPYVSTDTWHKSSLHTVPIEQQALIFNSCQHFSHNCCYPLFACSCPLVPWLWVETASTSEAVTIWYSYMQWKDTQREHTKFCRLSDVFQNESCSIVQVTWCWHSWLYWQCVNYGRKRECWSRQDDQISIPKILQSLGSKCLVG